MVKLNTIDFFQSKEKKYLRDLFDLLRIPSISRDTKEVRRAANWLTKRLKLTADYVEQVETSDNPVVLAEWMPQIEQNTKQQKRHSNKLVGHLYPHSIYPDSHFAVD